MIRFIQVPLYDRLGVCGCSAEKELHTHPTVEEKLRELAEKSEEFFQERERGAEKEPSLPDVPFFKTLAKPEVKP